MHLTQRPRFISRYLSFRYLIPNSFRPPTRPKNVRLKTRARCWYSVSWSEVFVCHRFNCQTSNISSTLAAELFNTSATDEFLTLSTEFFFFILLAQLSMQSFAYAVTIERAVTSMGKTSAKEKETVGLRSFCRLSFKPAANFSRGDELYGVIKNEREPIVHPVRRRSTSKSNTFYRSFVRCPPTVTINLCLFVNYARQPRNQ